MDAKVMEFLSKERISSLTTMLPSGMPHSGVLHFSFLQDGDGFKLYFSTDSTSKKAEFLSNSKESLASVTIGFSEQEWRTLQMDGIIRVVEGEALKNIKANHYKMHPNSQKFESDPNTIFLEFTPSWFRYTDFMTHPVTKISNE
jgi:general stress protein 26